MNNYILEDTDLLTLVEFNLLLDEEAINEASMYGMKISKENLEDEEFVKELVNKIKEDKHLFTKNLSLTLFVIGAISSITVIGLPIGILLLTIASKIKSPYDLQAKDLKKLDDCFEKTIDKLKKKSSNTKEKSKKEQIENTIKSLEENRERIYERKAKAEVQERLKKIVDFSKYGDHGIKVGSTEILCYLDDIAGNPVSYAKKYNNEEEIKSEFKSSKLPFDKIEQFYVNGVKTHDDFIKLIKAKGKAYNGITLMGGENSYDSYGKTVIKYLKDKQIVVIMSDVHDTTILYSYDDDCCYDWIAEETDDITKISVKDFLQASKTAYEDLIKIYKEFK